MNLKFKKNIYKQSFTLNKVYIKYYKKRFHVRGVKTWFFIKNNTSIVCNKLKAITHHYAFKIDDSITGKVKSTGEIVKGHLTFGMTHQKITTHTDILTTCNKDADRISTIKELILFENVTNTTKLSVVPKPNLEKKVNKKGISEFLNNETESDFKLVDKSTCSDIELLKDYDDEETSVFKLIAKAFNV